MVKVAISQRICPDFRVPVFGEIAKTENIDLTVFFGKGLKTGSQRNSKKIIGFKYKQLFTMPIKFFKDGIEIYRVFHPSLLFHLVKGNYDVVITEPSTNFLNNLVIFPYCKIFKKKFIWWEVGFSMRMGFIRRLIDPVIRYMIQYADACITSNSYADRCLERLGIPAKKIFRAQNTLDTRQIKVDLAKYRPQVPELRKKMGIEEAKIALFIGGIEKRKRIENLIKAAALLRDKGLDVRVLLVGDGPYTAELQGKLTPEERKFTIFIGRHIEDAPLYILASDVVVLPGQGGLSINHAFACGKPCIATQEAVAGGSSVYDYIKDGFNGFVIRENNIDALVDVLERLITDPSLYDRLCKGALKTDQNLSIKNMVTGITKAIYFVASQKQQFKMVANIIGVHF